jgi:hypothetical protein
MTELQQEAIYIMETIEDTVEHICDTEMLSGEKVWVMISALADLHINQFPNS